MRALTNLELHHVSAAAICINGVCKIVPTNGVPANYYTVLDNVYNQWLNGKISYQKLDEMLATIPWKYEEQYLINLQSILLK